MDHDANIDEAIDLLQQLGLKEYEARCFVGLSRLPSATAKRLAEMTDVPRTRVYDAIRVLEAQGLVQVQHSSPQQFRAVPLEEATETLRTQYEDRVDRFNTVLADMEEVEADDEDPVQEVWSMTGGDAIANRTDTLLENATSEVVLVVGDESLLTDPLVERLNGVGEDAELVVGAVTDHLQSQIRERVPEATTFLSGLEWLHGSDDEMGDTGVGRLLLVDRSALLVSTVDADSRTERCVFGEGFENGLVVVARRLMAQGLKSAQDPSQQGGD